MYFRYISIFILGLLISATAASAQTKAFNKQTVKATLKAFTDEQVVEFVNKNFYALYSADFAFADSLATINVALCKKHGWIEAEALALTHFGVVKYLGGDYRSTLPAYIRARNLFDSLNHMDGVARVNNELFVLYRRLNNMDEALACLDLAERAASTLDNPDHLGTTYSHRTSHHLVQKEYDVAQQYAMEVLKIRTQQLDSVGLGYVLLDLAEISVGQNKAKEAAQYILEAITLREKINDIQGVAVCYVEQGEMYLSFNQITHAIESFQKGLAISNQVGYINLSEQIHGQLAEVYANNQQFSLAYKHLQQNQLLRDSMFNVKKAQVLTEMETQYQTERKERLLAEANLRLSQRNNQIILLSIFFLLLVGIGFLINRNSKLKQLRLENEAKLRLQLADAEKQNALQAQRLHISRELHDNIGSQLTFINSSIDAVGEVEKVEELKRLTVETIRELRKTVWLVNHADVTIEAFVIKLREYLNLGGSIPLTVQSEGAEMNFTLTSSVATNIFRAIQEAVNNAIKHAAATKIEVLIKVVNGWMMIDVHDNGRGFSGEPSNASFGLKNMRSRIKSIQGTLSIDSKEGNTSILMKIPLLENKAISTE